MGTKPVYAAGYNPKWLAFLATKGLTAAAAEGLDRVERIALNAEFLCWSTVPR